MDALGSEPSTNRLYRLLSRQGVVMREISLAEDEVGPWLSSMMTHFGWDDVHCNRGEQSVDFVERLKA